MSSKKNSGAIKASVATSSNAAKRNLQTINAITAQMQHPSPNLNLSSNKKAVQGGGGGGGTRNQRFLNKTIEPMTNMSQGAPGGGASSNLMAGHH